MSTPNFAASHTKNIYAIGDCSDFAQYECQECLKEFNWELCDEYDRHSNRSYPASIIGEKTKCICVAGASIDITAQAKIVAGYYSGACFDFDCRLVVYDRDGYRVSEYDDLDDIQKNLQVFHLFLPPFVTSQVIIAKNGPVRQDGEMGSNRKIADPAAQSPAGRPRCSVKTVISGSLKKRMGHFPAMVMYPSLFSSRFNVRMI